MKKEVTSQDSVLKVIYNNTQYGVYIDGLTGAAWTYVRENNFSNNGSYDIYNNRLYVDASTDITATYNWFGTTDCVIIRSRIYDSEDNASLSTVNFEPFIDSPYPAGAPVSCP